ncbi:MAG: caspase family protein [Burkholderiales bacterium]|nr:caspase family protein [Burkholderiales bacterium]
MRATLAVVLLVLLPLLAGCTAAPRGTSTPARVALVIGNAAYENARPLDNPVHDAQDMCKALGELGFVTLCRTNVRTRAEFASLVDEYVGRLGPGTAGVVYYAGHGVQVGGANFLVPTQGQPEGSAANPLAALFAVDDLFERLRERPARLNIVMLDACRTELFDDGARPPAGRGGAATAAPANAPRSRLMRELQALPRAGSGLATIRDAPPRTMVLYATAAKSAAFDGDDRNGPLTKHILKHIGTRDQLLESFFKRVTDGVETETLRDLAKRQSPFTYGSFAGRFCFNGCPGDGPGPPPAN